MLLFQPKEYDLYQSLHAWSMFHKVRRSTYMATPKFIIKKKPQVCTSNISHK
jgi:hypothetical protein